MDNPTLFDAFENEFASNETVDEMNQELLTKAKALPTFAG